MIERRAMPALRRLALVGAPVINHLGLARQISTPAQLPALVYWVESIENDDGASERNAGVGDALAETNHQLALAPANQTRLGHPCGKLAEGRLVHVPNSSVIARVGSP